MSREVGWEGMTRSHTISSRKRIFTQLFRFDVTMAWAYNECVVPITYAKWVCFALRGVEAGERERSQIPKQNAKYVRI